MRECCSGVVCGVMDRYGRGGVRESVIGIGRKRVVVVYGVVCERWCFVVHLFRGCISSTKASW